MLVPLSVRAKLLWLTMGVVSALLVAGFLSLWSLWSASRSQIEASLEQQAQIAAGAFEQQIAIHRQTLDTVAILAGGDIGPDPTLQSYLNAIVRTRPEWIDIRIIGPGETVIAAQQSKPANFPAGSIDRLAAEVSSGSSFVTIPETSEDQRLHLLLLARPIGDNLVIGRVDVSSTNAVFDSLDLPEDNIIAVFDSDNRLIYRNRPQTGRDAADGVEAPLFSALAARHEGVVEILSPYDNIERAYGLAPVKTGNYIVAVGVPTVNLYRPARRQFAQQALVGLLVAAFAIIVAFQFARQIVGPLSKLREAARAFGAGDTSVRAEPIGGGTIRELELSFNQMAEKIAAREEQLQALDKLKSEFVSSVSHELRTPLTTIKALTRVLQSDKISAADREEYLDTIASECDRQIHFVQGLLDLSRIEAGAYKVTLTTVDTTRLLTDLARIKNAAASSRDMRILLDLPEELPKVSTDAKALRQIISGVLDNALKYSDDGCTITLSARKQYDKALIEICDEGCGIDAEDLPHIFERFYRGRPLTTADTNGWGEVPSNNVHGVGLGLYIVKNVADAMGAELEVQSPADGSGLGTRVVISLPVAETSALS